jgi:hypothetical protein
MRQPADVGAIRESPHREECVETLSRDWVWHDPFDDCSFAVQNGLQIHAANRRYLWFVNG